MIEAILDDFYWRAALAGVGVALAAAPLGCFVVWRRIAYFSDATAHAAILGVALALGFSMSVFVGAMVVALAMAVSVSALSGRGYAMDTALGVLAHSSLALGLVTVAMMGNVRIDVMGYLFGDILAVSRLDLAVIWGGVLGVLGLLWWRWSALLTSTLNPDLAYAAGLNPRREELVLMLSLAVVVAVAIKVVGVLLIGAMLLIPAAAARSFTGSPERMALCAAALGVASALLGLQASFVLDTPTGPTIVCTAAAFFAASSLFAVARRAF